MPTTEQLPATDSAKEIHDLVGDDSTATFESDPKFTEPTAGIDGSSDNLQDRADRKEIQNAPSLSAAAVADPDTEDEDDEDDEDEDDDEDLDDDDTEDDDADDEDLDDDIEDDDDEDEDEDDLDDDDDDEDDEEDDAVEAAASSVHPGTLRADGLLGYEDEAEDVAKDRDARAGNRSRGESEAGLDDESNVEANTVIRPVHEQPTQEPAQPTQDPADVEQEEENTELDTDVAADRALRLQAHLAVTAQMCSALEARL